MINHKQEMKKEERNETNFGLDSPSEREVATVDPG